VLANTLGNLVNRTVTMVNKYFDGAVTKTGVSDAIDDDLKRVVMETPARVTDKMDQLRVADAITEIFNLFKRCNKYIDETTPWVLARDEASKERLSEVLYNLIESICVGASLLFSFMPETSERILQQVNGRKRSLDDMTSFGLYESGNKVTPAPEILFGRLDLAEVMKRVEELHKASESAKPEESGSGDADAAIDMEAKPEITYDAFQGMQFQVGEVLSCEAVPKSKKLLCSRVKVGSRTMQIVSGIRKYYSPEEMVGKRVMVLANLKPAKLAGIESEGMLLCAEDAEGKLALMVPEKDMPSGALIC